MSSISTSAIFIEQDKMVSAIQEEIIEHTGKPYGFGFTENLFMFSGRVWHEFKMLDGTELLMYAYLDDHDGLHTVNELDEAKDFSFPW
jgi:hypothetical protein